MKRVRRRRQTHEMLEMLPEYDFSGGVRGKYASRFAKGAIMVVLDPDVAELFPDTRSVNKALRALGHIIRGRDRNASRRHRQAEADKAWGNSRGAGATAPKADKE